MSSEASHAVKSGASALGKTRLRIHIPDPKFVWLSANILEEKEFDDGQAVSSSSLSAKSRRMVVEITEPGYFDDGIEEEQKLREVDLDYDSISMQNSDEHMPRDGVDDMVTLNYLHEASILDNLRRRFQCRKPYTYTGGICVAINPYAWLDIYTDVLKTEYAHKLRHEFPPHVYATSAQACRSLLSYGKNQSILVSGESGAGKTETVKILMKHVAFMSAKKSKGSGGAAAGSAIIEKILKANPLLEAFGNAQTVRNDNSSRFGKFTQMHFEGDVLSGSKCVTYLLEKSRVVAQSPEERNYHIFHSLCACPAEQMEALCLSGMSATDFRYLCESNYLKTSIEGTTDADRYVQTMQALELLGVSDSTRIEMGQVLSGILYLGQATFAGDNDKSQLLSTECTLKACMLLGLDHAKFLESSTSRTIVEPGSGRTMSIPLGRDKAETARDALAKDLYERLFLWLVGVINGSTRPDGRALPRPSDPTFRTVSLLDIFGFESFDVNRFEQLCINYANEKLQQKFTTDFFSTVQLEYKTEGLEWDKIGFEDNSDILKLLEGPTGVIALLNEECRRNMTNPSGQDLSFVGKLRSNYERKHPHFIRTPKMRQLQFGIAHYAGEVTYNATSFVQRNKDALPLEVSTFLAASTNRLVVTLFGEKEETTATTDADATTSAATGGRRMSAAITTAGGPSARRGSFMLAETVMSKFRAQLGELMDTVSATEVQYVRCVKPNRAKSDALFDRRMVTSQLRCAGMIEAIRISRAAYPYRVLHLEFLARFGLLRCVKWTIEAKSDGSGSGATDVATTRCNEVIESVLPEQMHCRRGDENKRYEAGKTKIYFRSEVLSHLEEARAACVVVVVKVQSRYRGAVARKEYRIACKKVVLLQSTVRARQGRTVATRRKAAVACLQGKLASNLHRQRFLAMRTACTNITATIRGFLQVRRYRVLWKEEQERIVYLKSIETMKARLKEEEAAAKKASQPPSPAMAMAVTQKEEEGDGTIFAAATDAEHANNVAIAVHQRQFTPNKGLDQEQGHGQGPSADIAAVEAMQAETARLTAALSAALASNDELREQLAAQRRETESRQWQDRTRELRALGSWKQEKEHLLEQYMDATTMLDDTQARLEAVEAERRRDEARLAASHEALVMVQMDKSALEGQLWAERRARRELAEASMAGTQAMLDVSFAPGGGSRYSTPRTESMSHHSGGHSHHSRHSSPFLATYSPPTVAANELSFGSSPRNIRKAGAADLPSSATSVSSFSQITSQTQVDAHATYHQHQQQQQQQQLTAANIARVSTRGDISVTSTSLVDAGSATSGTGSVPPPELTGPKAERQGRRRSRRILLQLRGGKGRKVSGNGDDGGDDDVSGGGGGEEVEEGEQSAEAMRAALIAEHKRQLEQQEKHEQKQRQQQQQQGGGNYNPPGCNNNPQQGQVSGITPLTPMTVKKNGAAAPDWDSQESSSGDEDGGHARAHTVIFGSDDDKDEAMKEAGAQSVSSGWFGWGIGGGG